MSHNDQSLIFEHSKTLRLVPTDKELAELEQRNEERRQAAIAALGKKWVGVSFNQTERAD